MNGNGEEDLKKNIDDVENSEELKKEMLKPIVKSKSETEKELQDLEVETTGGGIGGGGG
jgi:ribosomal protein S9